MIEDPFMNDPFFSEFFDNRRNLFNLNRLFNGNGNGNSTMPPINIREQEKSLELELAAPGLSKDDFKITLDKGILTISSEKEQSKEEKEDGFLRKEFSYNSFSRSLSLPETVDEDKDVKATYDHGILKISLSKKPDLKNTPPRSIKVS